MKEQLFTGTPLLVIAGWRETVRSLTHRDWFGRASFMVKQLWV